MGLAPAQAPASVEVLVARAQDGDTGAFAELVVLHQPQVRRLIVRFIGPTSEVEDVAQEVFTQLFRSLHTFRQESKFSTWLYRIGVNVAKMHLRAKAVRPRFSHAPGALEEERFPGGQSGVAEDIDPEEALERNRRVAALYRHVQALPEKKRSVLILHDFEGLTPKDIAEVLAIPVMTVRTRLFYARKDLYEAIGRDALLAPSLPAADAAGTARQRPAPRPQNAVDAEPPADQNARSGR